MLGARMPEAAVHEHRHAGSPEYYVGFSRQVLKWANVHPVAHSQRMQRPSQSQFRRRVPGADATHPSPSQIGRWWRWWTEHDSKKAVSR